MEGAIGSGWRAWAGWIGAPLVFGALWLAPLPLEPGAHRLAAIFAAVLALWLTEAIPIAVTALLIAPLLVVCGITTPGNAFKHYADPLLYLFVGGFFIAEAMSVHGLDRRIAKAIVAAPGVRGAPARVRVALMVAGAVLSMWMANTAATAILVPILLKLIGARRGADRAASGGVLALAYACSAGGLGTLVGSPPNLITVRFLAGAGTNLGFLDWMKIGVPSALVVGLAIWLVVSRLHPAGRDGAAAADAGALFDDVPARWTRGEKVTAIAFALAVAGWVGPGIPQALGHASAAEVERLLHPGVVALVAASVLFFVPRGEGAERVLSWRQAAGIDWGVILLFGGGIALGTQLVETGLAAAISRGFVAMSGIASLWTLTFVACAFTIFFTEVCSNTASANMLVPLVIGIATELDVSPVPPALAVGLAASCAFMLPIATGPNAIAFSTGRVTQLEMMRTGLALNVVATLLVFACVRLFCPLLGWA
ncbi:MAG: SLC13/DASS family transporter [Sandaracinaceae bacterium]|nr:SLC13/DASS family transporter [Sandaracinaceae bacterium]